MHVPPTKYLFISLCSPFYPCMIGHHSSQLFCPNGSSIPEVGQTSLRSFTFSSYKDENQLPYSLPSPSTHPLTLPNSTFYTFPSLPPNSTSKINPFLTILPPSRPPSENASLKMTHVKLLSPPGIGETMRDSHRFSQVAKLDNVYETAGQSTPLPPLSPPPHPPSPSPHLPLTSHLKPPSALTAPSPQPSPSKSSKSSRTCKLS